MILHFFELSIVLSFVYMSAVYFFALKINNFSIVDIAWSAGFALVVLMLAFISGVNLIRNQIIVIMVSIWSLRLAYHLFVRIKNEHPSEEGRYVTLRKKWEPHVKRNFYVFFILQGFSVAFLALPFFIVFSNTNPNLVTCDYLAVLIWLVSILGESISDYQLKKFKMNPANKGRVCDTGFWYFSRHPNYFFEWMIWVSFFLMAVNGNYGYFGAISPSIIIFLLFKITGIPATEAQSLKSKGAAYTNYQNTTSVFVPWFKKKT